MALVQNFLFAVQHLLLQSSYPVGQQRDWCVLLHDEGSVDVGGLRELVTQLELQVPWAHTVLDAILQLAGTTIGCEQEVFEFFLILHGQHLAQE